MNNQTLWKICCASAVVLAVLTFTPVITPSGVAEPELLGMPYTLWTGIVQAILLIVLTYIGTIIRSRMEKED